MLCTARFTFWPRFLNCKSVESDLLRAGLFGIFELGLFLSNLKWLKLWQDILVECSAIDWYHGCQYW